MPETEETATEAAATDADTTPEQPASPTVAIDADEVLIDTVSAEDEEDPAPATDPDPADN